MDINENALIKLAQIDDIPKGGSLVVKGPFDDEIALFNVDGKIYATSNVCPHEGGPLGDGDIDCGQVTCPWHGWQFEIATGECVNIPGEQVKTYEVKIINESVYINDES